MHGLLYTAPGHFVCIISNTHRWQARLELLREAAGRGYVAHAALRVVGHALASRGRGTRASGTDDELSFQIAITVRGDPLRLVPCVIGLERKGSVR
jgi:hypothetical protein